MNSKKPTLTCADARDLDIVAYLSSLGYEPHKIRWDDYWYLSPLREEQTPSFKVNRKLNRWYDHGMGKGGNLVDFALLYHQCTIGELLQSLSGNPSFHKPIVDHQTKKSEPSEARVIIKQIKPITSLVLIRYLHSRKIPLIIAEKFCREVHYEMNGKLYYSIGFPNDDGGYEMRNSFCKNSSSPKAISTLKNRASRVAVFEGFFDFLSFASILSLNEFLKWDYCILNSLSFFERTKPLLEQYSSIHLFLDNDKAGQNCSRGAISCDTKYVDESKLYKHYKDLNEWLVGIGKKEPPTHPK